MATIDATVGGTSSNSFMTLAEADAYWADNYHSTAWDALIDDDKNKLLIMATQTLDYWVDWIGHRATEDQALRWPRYDVQDLDGYTFDSDIIPNFLKDATAELASYFISYNPAAEPDTKGFSEIRVDVIALKIDKADRDGITSIPDYVLAIIEPYGTIRTRGGDSTVTLIRA